MRACTQILIVMLVAIFSIPQAFGQKADDSDIDGGRKAADQRSEQGRDYSNAQWSEGATRGQDRAAEVRSEPEREKEQKQEMKKGDQDKEGRDKEGKQQKKNDKGKKK